MKKEGSLKAENNGHLQQKERKKVNLSNKPNSELKKKNAISFNP